MQSEQRQLRERLAQLKKRLAASEASHSEATDALADSEASISGATRRLRELAEARRQIERQIAALQERSRGVAERQSREERQLAEVLKQQFVLTRIHPLQRLIAGDNPHRLGRDLVYLQIIARDQSQSIDDLHERREELAQLEVESRARQNELATIAAEERQSRAQLLRQQAARKQTMVKLARQISGQRQSIATLERDEQRLGSLVEQIGRLLAEQARKQANDARRRAPAQSAVPPSTREKDPAAVAGKDIERPAGTALARLRGKLVLPVKGTVTAQFGSARQTEAGVNAPTWKGVFIRAATGADVHSVAAGRVVFADWLRGFGNLLILDHGDGFLSVYGNNETLLASAGEKADAGEVIATVGNTGGNADSGIYFEMRFQGRPIDPLRWAQAR